MIVLAVVAVVAAVVGILMGASADALLRGRDPRSRVVVAFGLAGALGGAAARYVTGSSDMLVLVLSAVVGGLLLAFIARARLSARLARAR